MSTNTYNHQCSNDVNFASYKTGVDIAEFYLSDKVIKREKKNEIVKKIQKKSKLAENTNLKSLKVKFENSELSSVFLIKIINGKLTMTHNRLSNVELTEVEKDKWIGVITFFVK